MTLVAGFVFLWILFYVIGFLGTLLYIFEKSTNRSTILDIFVALIWPVLIAQKAISLFMALGTDKDKEPQRRN